MRSGFAVALLSLALASALAAPEEVGVARGRALFTDTQDHAYPSCAHCHAVVPEDDEKRLEHVGPGATLHGAAVREGWRNLKTYADVGEASQLCAKAWQKRRGGLKPGELDDLRAYLRTIAPSGPLPPRKVQKTPRMLDGLEGGDAERGKSLAARFCGGCHHDREGTICFELVPGKRRRDLIARKVRGYDAKNRFDPQEGSMSYFTNDRLPDEDLRHILAYLGK
ncbi:MAG: c-type cytochrome [Planctomycetota bacterium]